MELQKPGNSQGPGTEVVERQRVAKEQTAQRVLSWIVQNEMRSVLGRVSAGAAGRIFDSANLREIRSLTVGCAHCSVDERKHSEHNGGAQVPWWKSREPVCRRISMRQYVSSPRKDKTGYER